MLVGLGYNINSDNGINPHAYINGNQHCQPCPLNAIQAVA